MELAINSDAELNWLLERKRERRGGYKTKEDVKADFKAGKITRAQAAEYLKTFGGV